MPKARKKVGQYLHEQFHFANMTEYLIFLCWAAFVAVFFLNIVN